MDSGLRNEMFDQANNIRQRAWRVTLPAEQLLICIRQRNKKKPTNYLGRYYVGINALWTH